MASRLFIDGIDFTAYADGLEDLVITYSMGDSKLMGVSISNEIKLTGAAHNYVHATFFGNPCLGKFAKLSANIVMDCCSNGDELSFTIDYAGVKVSDLDCETIINLKARNPLEACYEYMRDTPYFFGFAQTFEQAYNSPKIHYQIQRNNFWILLFLLVRFFIIMAIIEVFEQVIRFIISVITTIIRALLFVINIGNNRWVRALLDLDYDIPSLDNYLGYLTGSGNYHFAPYIRDIFQHNVDQANLAGACTIELDFELLETLPYSELALFQAFAKGETCTRKTRRFKVQAAYNRTLIQLLEELEPIFRLKSGITPGGLFVIATEDRFHEKAPIIFSAEKKFIDGYAEDPPVYSFLDGKLIRITSVTYSEDSQDIESKYKIHPEYSDDKIWGSYSGADRNEIKIPFGPSRFMYDSETAKVDNWYDDDRRIDDLRAGRNIAALIPGLNWLGWDNITCLPRYHDLIMSGHTAEYPKLLVLEPGTDIDDAAVVKTQTAPGSDYWIYNYPMHLEHSATYQELMKRFHSIDDPLNIDNRVIQMEDFTVALDSSMLTSIKTNGLFVGIQSKYGVSTPKEIEIRVSNCTATFKGLEYKCQP